jgi:uncharacterized protein (TIGR02147 family)
MELPSVFDFIDIKQYLRVYRVARKKVDAGFTNIYICYALGQKNSKGYFNNVINGRVRIGPTLTERFISLLELKGDEACYFRAVVTYSQSRDQGEQEQSFREMVKHNRSDLPRLTEKSVAYYFHWRYALVRALLNITSFNGENFDVLSKELLEPLSQKELQEAIDLLMKLSLIKKDEGGFWKPATATLAHSKEIEQELLLMYQAKNFEHSRAVIVNKDIHPQKITTMTLSMTEESFIQIKDKVSTLKKEIRSIVANEAEAKERLYQINIHLFPQSM